MDHATERARRFYGRHAGLYHCIATRLPGVGRLRDRVVTRMNLVEGADVLEVGCGTGANLPQLRRRVGDSGRVLGVDFTPEMLGVAADTIDRKGWDNVHLAKGDATHPPATSVDGVLASFLVGMLSEPADAVDRWIDCAVPGGRIALLDAAPSRRRGRPLNPAFRIIARVGAPPGTARDHEDSPAAVLHRRVARAHDRLREVTVEPIVERPVLGFLWLTVGTVPDES